MRKKKEENCCCCFFLLGFGLGKDCSAAVAATVVEKASTDDFLLGNFFASFSWMGHMGRESRTRSNTRLRR